MEHLKQKKIAGVVLLAFAFYGITQLANFQTLVSAQTTASPQPTAPSDFNQAAAIAKLKEQIKGRENESAYTVFKNLQLKGWTTARHVVAAMEIGYARSLGVDCTHCHVPDKWEVEEKPTKQITRDMSAMQKTINEQLLKNIKGLKSEQPIVNCTTCHRGQIKPALNLPAAK